MTAAADSGQGLRLAAVEKRFGEVVALAALDLAAATGELLVLVGPSGSGKSTALRVLAGLEQPSAGRVHISGRDVTGEPPHRRDVAMVFQDYALYPHLSVRENLEFGPRVRREPAAPLAERVERVAAQLGLDLLLDRRPDQLSGGQQQRVALARAMVREPRVYLMDEPLSNLDAQLRLATRGEIVELHRRLGTTTVYVTHDQAEAMTMGDRVAVLADGRLQQVGAPQTVYDQPANLFVAGFFGSPPMNLVPGGGVLGGEPGTVVGVRPEDLVIGDVAGADGPGGGVAGSGRPGDGPTVLAQVRVVEPLGSETVLACDADGTRVAVRTGPRSRHRPGDELHLRVAPGRRHVFASDSGTRLP